MFRLWIIKLLGKFSKTERPTEDELIAYGRQLEREEVQKRTYIWIDPTIRTRGYPQVSAYEPPERTTDPTQLGIRRRATMHRFQENPGILMQHHAAMHKRAQTVKLDPETVQLPNVNPLRKLTMQRYDGPPLPDTTMASIPTWIL